MRIKNLKCYLLGAIILTNASFASCALIEDEYDRIKNKDFYDFLEDNGIVAINDLHNITRNYYEAEVADDQIIGDEIITGYHYERIDDIDYVVCQGREYDYDYKVLKVQQSGDGFEVTSKIIEDIDKKEQGYDYVYEDDYVINDGYRDVLIRYGKILKR